jgi:D-arabinose 1-dehydrogenase-like Zn-dependent alcohol dehydrogenase
MQAVVFDGKNLQIKEMPKPKIKPNQVLVKVNAVGICGTDLAIAKGHLPTPVPLILGHEIVGEVIELGKKVDPVWLHKRITPEINANKCGKCFYCQQKMFTQCVTRKALGIDIDGGMAEYIALDDYLLHEIPSSFTDNQATFIEPVAAAYQTFEMMPLTKTDRVMAIFGMGKMGLILVQVAKAQGLNIIAIDGSDVKLN